MTEQFLQTIVRADFTAFARGVAYKHFPAQTILFSSNLTWIVPSNALGC